MMRSQGIQTDEMRMPSVRRLRLCKGTDAVFAFITIGIFFCVLTYAQFKTNLGQLSGAVTHFTDGMVSHDLEKTERSILGTENLILPTTSVKVNSKQVENTVQLTEFEVPTEKLLQNITQDSYFDWHLDHFNVPPGYISFLPNYKSPCWFESVGPKKAYKYNYYALMGKTKHTSRYVQAFSHMKQVLNLRVSDTTGLSWRIRCLPFFYIPGFSRCGSTDIMQAILRHPHVIPSYRKELIYWNRVRIHSGIRSSEALVTEYTIAHGRNSRKLTPDEIAHLKEMPRSLNQYVESFDYQAEMIRQNTLGPGTFMDLSFHPLIFGDATPSYMWGFDTWASLDVNKGLLEPRYTVANYIQQLTPLAKIIIILRNPVDRLYSDFKAFGFYPVKTAAEFHKKVRYALNEHYKCMRQNTLRGCLYTKTKPTTLRLRIGIYYVYIEDWLKLFPRRQFFFTRLEDYAAKKKEVLENVFEFLELDPLTNHTYKAIQKESVKNTGNVSKTEPMWKETRRMLETFYAPFNNQLAYLLHDDIYLWQ